MNLEESFPVVFRDRVVNVKMQASLGDTWVITAEFSDLYTGKEVTFLDVTRQELAYLCRQAERVGRKRLAN